VPMDDRGLWSRSAGWWRDLPDRVALAAIVILLSGIDFIVTILLLDRGAVEANPLMEPIVGSVWGWFLKTVVVGAVMIFLVATSRDGKLDRMLRAVVAVYVCVVVWNLVVLARVP
jgi:hypothetical protein